MLRIVVNLNKSNFLTSNYRLVSFNIINMFLGINNIPGLKAAKKILDATQDQFPPTDCIIEVLKMCLECNNSIFNDKHFLQNEVEAQGSHMSCSYSDIAMQYFDIKSFVYTAAAICWKKLKDDIFIVWSNSTLQMNLVYILIS